MTTATQGRGDRTDLSMSALLAVQELRGYKSGKKEFVILSRVVNYREAERRNKRATYSQPARQREREREREREKERKADRHPQTKPNGR